MTIDPGGRSGPALAWWGLSGSTCLFCTRFVLERDWGRDYWEHAAAATEFARAGIHPRNPYTGASTSSFLLTPWHFAVGELSRVGDFGVERTIQVVAVVQLVAFLAALRAFARRFVDWPWAPAALLLAVLLVWGWQPWVWSGLPDLNGLGSVIAYPSMAALAVVLAVVVGFDRWLGETSRSRLAWSALGIAVVAAISPISLIPLGVLVGGSLVAAALSSNVSRSSVLVAGGLGIAAVGVGLRLTWVPPGRLFDASPSIGATNEFLFVHVGTRLGLAVPGAIGVWLRRKRDGRLDPIAVSLVLAVVVFVIGDATTDVNLGRALVVIALALQVGWVELLRRATAPKPRAVVRVAFVATIASGCAGAYSAVARSIPRPLLPARYADDPRQIAPGRTELAVAKRFVHPSDVVADFTQDLPATFVVASARILTTGEDPLIPDLAARDRALSAIEQHASRAIDEIGRWKVTLIWCNGSCDGWTTTTGARVLASSSAGTLVSVRELSQHEGAHPR